MFQKFNINSQLKSPKRFLRLTKNLYEFDRIIWGIPLFLIGLSGILIASTQRQINYADWYNHWITGLIGFLIATQVSKLPLERLRPFLFPLYVLNLLSLTAVKFIGVSALGAQRWLNIGVINIQPSELSKLIVILSLAAILERTRIDLPLKLLKPCVVILLPWILIFLQPDLGSSLVFGAILLTMLYWNGMPLEWVLLSISTIITSIIAGISPWLLSIWIPLMGFLAFRSLPKKTLSTSLTVLIQSAIALITPWLWINGLKEYQRDRLVLFLDPSQDPLGGGYHLLQSTVGIGSGGLLGSGLLQGQLTKLRFIPEQHTDFIFSALGEEMGFTGSILVILSFTLLIIRLIKIAKNAHTEFESLVVIGITSMLFFQIVVNIFMTIGLGPVTGIPLPFMSYGRTALVVNLISIGLCVSVAKRANILSKSW